MSLQVTKACVLFFSSIIIKRLDTVVLQKFRTVERLTKKYKKLDSMTSWFGGAIPPDSPKEERKSDDIEEKKDQVEKTDDAVEAESSETTTPVNEDIDPAQMIEDASLKAYTTAKAWGSYLFSVSKVATKTVAKTAMQLKDKVEETAPIISDFTKEQKKFKEEKQETKRQNEAAVPPWVGYNEESVMKDQILALSLDRRNFLRNPPAGVPFHFEFSNIYPVAIATLQDDPNLAKMRFELVPKMTSEENFWRNYFYRVSLIKQSTQLTSLAQQTGSTSESDSRGSSEDNGTRESLAAESPLGASPPEHEFVSDAFQSTVTEDDIRREMEQMRITNQQEDEAKKSSPSEEDIPEWEKELQQELQEYDMMDNDPDDVDIESEILKQLEAETEAELQQ